MIELDRLFCLIGKGRELRLYDKRSQYSEDNDFHDRPDLSPNLCALYVDEKYRNRGIAGKLLEYVRIDMSFFGLKRLYLVTDHDSFYERYDWTYLCMVNDLSCGEPIRMYEKMIDRH